MPILNETQNLSLTYHISSATTLLARLTGLLGRSRPDVTGGLHIVPCTSVHTFGMSYPIDVVFLSKEGKALSIIRHLAPNRMTGTILSAGSALEFPSGTLAEDDIRVGDTLKVESDGEHCPSWAGVGTLLHWPMNLCIASLWLVFLYASYLNWQQTGQMSSLGLVGVNGTICVLFLIRRVSSDTSKRAEDWFITFIVVGLAMFLRPHPTAASTLVSVSLPVQAVGIAALIGSLLSLGRSFGLVPANRGVKQTGLYRFIRHPVYAGELILYLGFLLGNSSTRNVVIVILVVAGQLYRLVAEERLLRRDDAYRAYMKTVRSRLIPGIF